jgi:hypothetical protein
MCKSEVRALFLRRIENPAPPLVFDENLRESREGGGARAPKTQLGTG